MTQTLISPFATDEDIATRFRADFVLLCDREYMAIGTDGVFASGIPWALTSTSNNFALQGVGFGNVVLLKTTANTPYGNAGMLFAVDSVATNTANLRRLNLAPTLGVPPGPAAGLTGVNFTVPTLAAQIENASYELEHRFGINDIICGVKQTDMFDLREVRDVCVLTVVHKRFLDLARQSKENDVYFDKYRACKQELDDLLDRVVIHWTSRPVSQPARSRFSTRIDS